MRIGSSKLGKSFADKVEGFRQLDADGFASGWLPQISQHDTMSVITAAGAVTESLTLGVDVVPTFSRHPIVMAQQALSAQAATAASGGGGRFVLGIGLSHQVVVESQWGGDFSKPVRHMREYLTVLQTLLAGERVDFEGEEFQIRGAQIQAPDEVALPPVIVAALGPQMLRVAGRLADGTVTWLAGARYLEETVVPTITQAASTAGRAAPRVVVGLPVALTSDVEATESRIAKSYAFYNTLPSYQRVIRGSGGEGPADVSLIGDEAALALELRRLKEIGVTDLIVTTEGVDRESRARTYEWAKSLAPEF